MTDWQTVKALVVPGHQVASGKNRSPRFPGGTLQMQRPIFLALGLDLSVYYQGTINVSIAPCTYQVQKPRLTFRNVKWHPTEPSEDFSFFDVQLVQDGRPSLQGLIYFPHPETKPEHFQQPDVLELLFPFTKDVSYGSGITLLIPKDQMKIENDAQD